MTALKRSFSLVEVLVFVSILGIFFIAAIAITLTSLKDMQINQHKIIATRHAEELMEWLKNEKEADWSAFSVHSTIDGITYCFNNSLHDNWAATNPDLGSCGNFNGIIGVLPEIYKREAVLTSLTGSGSFRVDAKVTVSWNEASSVRNVELNSTFSMWE